MSGILTRAIGKYPELQACEASVRQAYGLLKETFRADGKLLLCGNGGSAADCEHIAGELMKGFLSPRPVPEEMKARLAGAAPEEAAYLAANLQGALPAVSLVSHSALFTAFANDVAADMAFAQQVYGYGRPGDALMAISTSGNSANVVNAVLVAKALGVRTIALTGRGGGRLAELCDAAIVVPYETTVDIQERHLPIYHALCSMLEEEFFP